MISTITRIQLIGKVKGYLDVSENVPVPMTYSVSDIRDISKRTGAFSKSIVLPNTKNNARLLNHYFDINIQAGTFNINKLQECILLQNNVPVTQNAYIQLVNIKKTQNVNTEDDFVEYEVLIKDNVGDFFTKLGGSMLEDIDFSDFIHLYTSTNIKNSFDNTYVDGYKYILPWIQQPSSGLPKYLLPELKPAIYAKQYWDRIHANAGFTYEWSTLTDNNVRFDKLLIPYNADDKKVTEETLELYRVIASREGQGTGIYVEPNSSILGYTYPFDLPLSIQTEILDPQDLYNNTTSKYYNPFLLNSPNGLDIKFEIDYDLIIENTGPDPVAKYSGNSYRPCIYIRRDSNNAIVGSPLPIGNSIPFGYYIDPGDNLIYTLNSQFSTTLTGLSSNDVLKFSIGMYGGNATRWGSYFPYDVNVRIVVRSLKMTISINASTVSYGFPINLNSYIPRKIKQSDFIKSICLMYNLYVETDPDNPNKLIYKHRDDFYDSGKEVDWTDLLARDKEQNLKFLPELTSKRLILTYKADKDIANEGYTTATKEIYGQHEVIFQNEYVKNIETKELLFSPTPVQPTSFGAVTPIYTGQSPNTNIRILLDNGQQSCGNYQIQNYSGSVETLNYYPLVSHMDSVVNPTFDINFGVCEYYFYDIVNYTDNNLFNNFWSRTVAQIDQGKLFTAYFALSEADIQKMKLNDKIRIDNSWWNINKIIDYDASSDSLTKVELISIDPLLSLPRFRGSISEWKPEYEPARPFKPLRPIVPLKESRIISSKLSELRSYNTSLINGYGQMQIFGQGNIINDGFRGIVIGDNRIVSYQGDGIVVGDWILKDDGTISYTNLKFIECGLDETMNKNKTNPIDIIDGGIDEVRRLGGYKNDRPFIDGSDFL